MVSDGRRNFIKGAALGAAALPLSVREALALPARNTTGSLKDVEHVVILMQENRSFDHYFGSLRGVRGFEDPRPMMLPTGKSVWNQPRGPGVTDSVLPFRLNSNTTSADCMKSLDHSWKGQHGLWKNHDAWIPVKGPLTMGHFTREDIPYYYALADAFTVCDAYHCSIHGPTNPNRLFFFSGTTGLSTHNYGLYNVTNDDDANWTADMDKDKKSFEGYAWTTYAERLEKAGISWKLYQEHDNYGDNSLAYFDKFRNLDKTSPLYVKARTWVEGSTPENATTSNAEHLVAAFAKDVAADTLPAVSWIVAPFKMCEHPDAPPSYGEVLSSRLIAALASNPAVWSKTVFILNYDENDGFFDHMPPPIPAINDEMGKSTVDVMAENFFGEPVGLGPRVPMIIVSPWTRGGWVNSQLFDHTSVLRFLEARFGVAEPNISPWRRAMTGDLTSAFDFKDPNGKALPPLPDTANYRAQTDAACKLEGPKVPKVQALPVQEKGVRLARALPYAVHVHAKAVAGALQLDFVNAGAAGACFNVYAAGYHGPWFYSVETGKQLSDSWSAERGVEGAYGLAVHGPNGFLREFHGDLTRAARPEVEARYEPAKGRIVLLLRNDGAAPCEVEVRANDYSRDKPRAFTLAPGATIKDAWSIDKAGYWYDLVVTQKADPGFARRLAGHVETGAASVSDPAIGRGVQAV
ncbi:phospholipase C, phosphocholine-specific [soil metagenome]